MSKEFEDILGHKNSLITKITLPKTDIFEFSVSN